MSSATTTAEPLSTEVACAHCGLPVRQPADHGASAVDTQPSFCCRGCRGAYDLIRGWGLEEFYELRESPGEEIPDETSKSLDDLDDPRLLGRSAPIALESASSTRPLLKSTLAISGLHCAACMWLIERAPERIPGWQSALVNMHSRSVEIIFDPTAIRLSDIARFLQRVGYEVSPLDEDSSARPDPESSRSLLVDVAIAGFCAANAMWIAIALYAGQFTGIAAGHAQFLRVAGVGLGLAAVVFPGRVFFSQRAGVDQNTLASHGLARCRGPVRRPRR